MSNDALLPGDDVLEGVVELQRDQHGHYLTEDGLEDFILERIQGSEHQPGEYLCDQTVESHQDDKREDEGGQTFKPLVEREARPFVGPQAPSLGTKLSFSLCWICE
jgi:hypothetical protein